MTPQQRLEACLKHSRISAEPKGSPKKSFFAQSLSIQAIRVNPRAVPPQLEENGFVCFPASLAAVAAYSAEAAAKAGSAKEATVQRFNAAKPTRGSQFSP